MDRARLFQVVDSYFDAERARKLGVQLTDYYRTPGSQGFFAATELVQDFLQESGPDDLQTFEYPVSNAWEPFEASLDVVSPDPVHLVDYASAPSCLAWWSDSTGPEGERLEVIDVGTGETSANYAGKDLDGKVAFIHGTPRRPAWWEAAFLAAEAGVRGIITDYMLYQIPGVRTPELVPDAVQLLRLRPPAYFHDRKVWAFSISPRKGKQLRAMLARGRVVVSAHVRCRTFHGTTRNVVATIRGAEYPEEHVLLCAHTSGIKPGANCAEGPALTAELFRAIKAAIDAGDLQRPARSIKLALGAEGPVSDHYLEENEDSLNNILVTLTYCSAGHNQQKTQSTLLLSRSPDSVAHFLNDYLAELAAAAPGEAAWAERVEGQELPLLSMTEHYYTPWSDNTRFAAAGLPAALFMSWPDIYFHSQFLTPDIIDPAVLRRAALVSGAAAVELASAGRQEAESIARIVASRSIERTRRLIDHYTGRLGSGQPVSTRARRHLEYQLERDVLALRSVSGLLRSAEAGALVRPGMDELEELLRTTTTQALSFFEDQLTNDPDFDETLAATVPVRTTDSASRWQGLSYQDLLELGAELRPDNPEAGFALLRVVWDEIWNFIDGRRSVQGLADAVGFEFDVLLKPTTTYRILQGLEEHGHITFEVTD